MFALYESQLKSTRFSPLQLAQFINGGKEPYQKFNKQLHAYDSSVWDPNLFNEGRVEAIKHSIKHLPTVLKPVDAKDPNTVAALSMIDQFQPPGSIHMNMFILCIDLMGTESQRRDFLDKCRTYEIIGCYAQTQLGHGSDVQSLQTTAIYDAQKDEFVINTPNIEAAKWWPGDMALYANWALVFARCIIEGKDHGIQNFLVKIRDQNHNRLPGVETGDIGPKHGYIAKDNGYMILNNVRIPKKNLLRRYVKLQKGKLEKKGNPKVGYATMMLVRRLLSGYLSKAYAQSITIAGKYSFARKQFKDDKKEDIPIINYQLQQNKLISCIAEHFAVQIGGIKTSNMTSLNIEMVNKDDDSLMKETHNCLCLAKALYTEYALRGMEICRMACGGHGFSQYSALPHIVQQFSPNVTLEGENTVLYLQLARYLMKAYSNSLSKKKPLGESVKYIESLETLMETKIKTQTAEDWTLSDIKTLLAQSALSLIQSSTERLMSDESQKKAWDFKAGIRLQQAAHSHAVYWTFVAFQQWLNKFQCSQSSKQVISNLCLLYGINSVLEKPLPLVESKLIEPFQLASLKQKKQNLLKSLRGDFAGLIQSLGVPQIYEKSALTHGNVYQNLFNLAKKNNINHEMSPAVEIVKKGISNTRPRM